MAEDIGTFLNETQGQLNILIRSMMERWNEERERANRLIQQQDELLRERSQARERESDLTRKVSEQNERIRELEQLVAERRARGLQARKKLRALEEMIKNMKEASDAAIPQEWHKARLLREQRAAITKSQIEMDELRKQLGQSHLQVSQRDGRVNELKLELECSRKTNRETEMAAQQKVEELQAIVSELRDELRLEIGSHSTALAQKDREASELLLSMASLKAENEMVLQETRGQLVEAQVDTTTFIEKLEIAAHELRDVRKELAAIQTSASALSTMGGADVIRSIGKHLRQLSQRSGKFCDPTHRKYLYLTDCGTFLCLKCLRRALPENCRDMALTIGSKDAFEIDCPWCRSAFWTWQVLPIPFSTSWMHKLEALTRIADRFESNRILFEKRMVVEEL